MNCSEALTTFNIIVALIGVFVLVTIYEHWRLRGIRKDFQSLNKRIRKENLASQKAMHRIIASYSATDADRKIELLEAAEKFDPAAYNLYNSMGWAWLEKGEKVRALNSFKEATRLHPEEKAGHFDLAYAYVLMNQTDLALDSLEKAVRVDPTSAADLKDNALFKPIVHHPRYQRLLS